MSTLAAILVSVGFAEAIVLLFIGGLCRSAHEADERIERMRR